MTTITLKNIPDQLHLQLRESAVRHHHSLNRDIIAQLETNLSGRSEDMIPELDALHRQLPEVNHDLVDELKRQGRA